MFFKRNVNLNKTIIEIHIYESSTKVSLSKNNQLLENFSLDFGRKDIIEKAYNEMSFVDNSLKQLNIENFCLLHKSKIYSYIKDYVSYIEYSILIKFKIPSKIDNVFIYTSDIDLFKSEFSRKFNNSILKAI